MSTVRIWRPSTFDTVTLCVQKRRAKLKSGMKERDQFWCAMKPLEERSEMKYVNTFSLYFLSVLSHEISVVKIVKPSWRFLSFISVERWKNQPHIYGEVHVAIVVFIEVQQWLVWSFKIRRI